MAHAATLAHWMIWSGALHPCDRIDSKRLQCFQLFSTNPHKLPVVILKQAVHEFRFRDFAKEEDCILAIISTFPLSEQ